jgi:hypothetical protein
MSDMATTPEMIDSEAPYARMARAASHALRGFVILPAALAAGFLLGSAAPVPDAKPSPCGDLQARIDAAIQAGTASIVLPAKAVCPSGPLQIAGAHGLTIDGQGATLLFSAIDKPGIRITGQSKGITLTHVVLDYAPLPFTQGRIDAVLPGRFSFVVDQGYPAVTAQKSADRVYLFDAASGKFKRGTSTLYFSGMRANLDGRGGDVPLAPRYRAGVQVGDLVVFSPRGAPAVQLDGLAEDIELSDVTIHAAPGMAIMARFVAGRNRFNVRIAPGPRPATATRDRLLSSNADAINYAYARSGPVIDHSYIVAQGDDAVNLHGLVLGVLRSEGRGAVTAVRPFGSDDSIPKIMKVGDPVRLLDRDSFAVLATVRLRAIERIDAVDAPDWQQIDQLYPRSHLNGKRSASFYRISVEGDLPPRAGYLEFPALAANGFSINDNHFADSRGHGMVIGASQGIIARNKIERITHNAIVLGPNFVPWREGGWVRGVSVRDNIVSEPCRDPSTVKGDFWSSATIAVSAQTGSSGSQSHAGNQDIDLKSNTIDPCAGKWLAVSNAGNVRVQNNGLAVKDGKGTRLAICPADRSVLTRDDEAVSISGNTCVASVAAK